MKKLFYLLAWLVFFNTAVWAYEVNPVVLSAVNDLQIVDYNPATRTWSRNLGLNDIVFSKHVTTGSGGYSEYRYNGKTYDVDSTYEFLCQGRLFGYNAHTLKLFELSYDGEQFAQRELTDEEIQFFFPDMDIIKVSQFDENNEFLIELPIFQRAEFMIINDTDRDFYKYQFERYTNKNKIFNNIFEVVIPRTLVFSHFKSRDEMFPVLKVKIKPKFKREQYVEEILY